MTHLAPPFEAPLASALPNLSAWTNYYQAAQIPVLQRTQESLEALRANEDRTDASSIGAMISDDPLMTLKVLIYASAQRSTRITTEIETVIGALVMMGIPPFFAAFPAQQTIDDRLADNLPALAGLNEVIRRAHRSANFALAVAVHRMDPDAAIVHAAALLHDFAEMLLWCHAPDLALKILENQHHDSGLRSSVAQHDVLNIELTELQQALLGAWRLPPRFARLSDSSNTQHPSARTVQLAVRLARHTAQGWSNPAISNDISEMAVILNLSEDAAQTLLQDI